MLGHLFHAGHHTHNAFHSAHLKHLVKLHLKVVHVELTLLEALHHAFGLFGLNGFLRFFNKADDVAHAKDTACDPFWVELLKSVHFLAQTHKLDRLACNCAHRKSRAATSVTVHTGQHNARDANLCVKFFGHFHSDLTCQTIDNQERLAWVHHIADVLDFFHQGFVDLQTARRIKHIDVIAAHCCLLLGPFCNLYSAFTRNDRQSIYANLRAENCQLLLRSRAINVERGQKNAFAVFLFQSLGKFTSGCRFTATLQTDHQDGGRGVVDFQ